MRPFFFLAISRDSGYQVLSPVDNRVYALNYAGSRILELCDGNRTAAEVVAQVAGCLGGAPNAAEKQVEEFLDEVTRLGLVAWREEPIAETAGWPPPTTVFWDITEACNLRCRHCYGLTGRPMPAELATAEVRRALGEMAACGVASLSFSGGEPLLRKDFLDIAEYAGSRGFASVGVATNGTLVTSASARRLKEAGLTAQVSIDGDTATVHDRMRGVRGAFDRALRGIRLLQEAGIDVSVCTSASTINVDRIPAIIELMDRIGVRQYRVQGVLPVGRGMDNREALQLPPQRMRELVAYLDERGVQVTSYNFTLRPPPEGPIDYCGSGACSAASAICSVTADGRVVPCSYFWGMNGASLREHTFGWVWEHSRLLRYFRTIRLADLRGDCRGCRWLSLCHGGCKAENVGCGDLFSGGGSCWVAEEEKARRM